MLGTLGPMRNTRSVASLTRQIGDKFINDGPAPETLNEQDFQEFYQDGFAEQIPADQVELPQHMKKQILYWPEALQYETEEQIDNKWLFLCSLKTNSLSDEYLGQEFELTHAMLTCEVPDFAYDEGTNERQFLHNIGRGGRKVSVKYKTLTYDYDPQITTFFEALDMFVSQDQYFQQTFPFYDSAQRPIPKNYRTIVNENGRLRNPKRIIESIDPDIICSTFFTPKVRLGADLATVKAPHYFSHADFSHFRAVARKTIGKNVLVVHLYFDIHKFTQIEKRVFKGIASSIERRLCQKLKFTKPTEVFTDPLNFNHFPDAQKRALTWMITREKFGFSVKHLESALFQKIEALDGKLVDFTNLKVVDTISKHFEEESFFLRGGILGMRPTLDIIGMTNSRYTVSAELRRCIDALVRTAEAPGISRIKIPDDKKAMLLPSRATLIICQDPDAVRYWKETRFQNYGVVLDASNLESHSRLTWAQVVFADVVLMDIRTWNDSSSQLRASMEARGKAFGTRYRLAQMPDMIQNFESRINETGVDLEGFFYHRIVYEQLARTSGDGFMEEDGDADLDYLKFRKVNFTDQFVGAYKWVIMDMDFQPQPTQQHWISILGHSVKTPMEEIAFMRNFTRCIDENRKCLRNIVPQLENWKNYHQEEEWEGLSKNNTASAKRKR